MTIRTLIDKAAAIRKLLPYEFLENDPSQDQQNSLPQEPATSLGLIKFS